MLDWLSACLGPKPGASGPEAGPKLPGPSARAIWATAIWDQFWVQVQYRRFRAQSGPKPLQNRPVLIKRAGVLV